MPELPEVETIRWQLEKRDVLGKESYPQLLLI